jgi:signal transduction histidine kinase/ligand-binding sensor domain-containing protein/DNA-binding response OmpR family regulator
MKKVWCVRLLFVLLFLHQKCLSQNNDHRFQHLSTQQGLSHNFITSIWQDKEGFMWFGTASGLNKYDGYNFTTFQFDPKEPDHTLQNNIVTDVREDQAGQLWVATLGGGLHYVDKKHGKMICYSMPRGLSNYWNILFNIYIDTKGSLWMGSALGIVNFNPKNKQFMSYPMERVNRVIGADAQGRLLVQVKSRGKLYSLDPKSGRFEPKTLHFPKNTVFSEEKIWRRAASGRSFPLSFQFDKTISPSAILLDKAGTLWIGTSGSGLFSLDSKKDTDTLCHYNPKGLVHQTIYEDGLYEDAEGFIWVASPSALQRIDQKSGQVINFEANPDVNRSLSSNDVRCMYLDKTGNYWIGTDNGINLAMSNPRPFEPIATSSSGSPIRVPEHNVQAILEDHQGTIWIGSLQKGLYQWLPDGRKLQHVPASPTERSGLASEGVGAIFEDSRGRLWVSTKEALHLFDRVSQKFTRYPTEIPILFMDEDAEGKLWMGGTVGLRGGIARFDPATKKFNYFIRDMTHGTADSASATGLNKFLVFDLVVSSVGDIWIATSHGINRLKPATGKFTYYFADPKSEGHLSDNWVRALYEDSNGTMWVGTHQGGLLRFDSRTETFSSISTKDGLSSNQVVSITGDSRGNLWMGTGHGISRFNPANQTFRNFDARDGLPDDEFNIGSVYNRKDKIFFGSVNGAVAFHADDIEDNDVVPPVHITSLKVMEKSRPMPEGELQLQHDENFLSFDFVSLNYNVSEKNQYAYQLEGLDKDWIYSGSRRFANYTDLSPGAYTFRVKASNNDGIWNTSGASLKIIITPPWWSTWWAYVLYAITGLCLTFVWRRHLIMQERLRNQLRFERLTSEKLQEIDALKTRFFANLSHEFRTPLSLIRGTVQKLQGQEVTASDQQADYHLIGRQTGLLLEMINQLLDLSKLEAGKLSLNQQVFDLSRFLKNVSGSFASLFEVGKISYRYTVPILPVWVHMDQEKLGRIIANLLSNAAKFTSSNGEVRFAASIEAIEVDKSTLQIIIEDTGIGISKEHLPRIFDRFYQVDNTATRNYQGTGIGLAVVKELVELHGGTIVAESMEGKGTTFQVRIPLMMAAEGKPKHDPLQDKHVTSSVTAEESSEEVVMKHKNHELSLLVVEDNQDLRNFIVNCFSKDYSVRQAPNGEEGLRLAFETIPDLIISDIMMPVVNGINLCGQLKTDERTSHIPIILLTAKADIESKLAGLQNGADDYLIKPFNREELMVRVKNLVESRKVLKAKYSKRLIMQPSDVSVTSVDDKFIKKTLLILEGNLSNTDFDVNTFSKEIGMSHTHLHRKLTALLGQSPSELIRTFRLKRAATLLERKHGNVSEIAFMVGFNNPTYFTKCFRELFGQTPSEYAKEHASIQQEK